jgi:hypothetical protein
VGLRDDAARMSNGRCAQSIEAAISVQAAIPPAVGEVLKFATKHAWDTDLASFFDCTFNCTQEPINNE